MFDIASYYLQEVFYASALGAYNAEVKEWKTSWNKVNVRKKFCRALSAHQTYLKNIQSYFPLTTFLTIAIHDLYV